jgi:hypothetical protein
LSGNSRRPIALSVTASGVRLTNKMRWSSRKASFAVARRCHTLRSVETAVGSERLRRADDARDLKSPGDSHAGSTPAVRTKTLRVQRLNECAGIVKQIGRSQSQERVTNRINSIHRSGSVTPTVLWNSVLCVARTFRISLPTLPQTSGWAWCNSDLHSEHQLSRRSRSSIQNETRPAGARHTQGPGTTGYGGRISAKGARGRLAQGWRHFADHLDWLAGGRWGRPPVTPKHPMSPRPRRLSLCSPCREKEPSATATRLSQAGLGVRPPAFCKSGASAASR